MKTVVIILCLVWLSSCGYSQTKKERTLEQKAPEKGVLVVPNDSTIHNMPVQKVDTYRNNMPVLDTDTSKVKPK